MVSITQNTYFGVRENSISVNMFLFVCHDIGQCMMYIESLTSMV